MATSFDLLPVYDPILNNKTDILSDVWISSFSTLMDNIISYLSEYGISIPNITEDQRDQIINPKNGQLIINTTLDAPQFYQSSSSSWKTISFT